MYEKNRRSWLKHLDFILLDLLMMAVAFTAAFSIRFEARELHMLSEGIYRSLLVIFFTMQVMISFFLRSNRNVVRRNWIRELQAILKQNAVFFLCVLTYLVFTKQSGLYSRLFLGYFAALNLLLMLGAHTLWKAFIRSRYEKHADQDQLLLVTEGSLAVKALKRLQKEAYPPYRIHGVALLDESKDQCPEGLEAPVVADRSSLLEYIRTHVVDQALVCTSQINAEVTGLAKELLKMGVVVHISVDQSLGRLPNKQIHRLGGCSVVTSSIQNASVLELFLKRTLDICGALVGMVLVAVATLLVGPVIYRKSPGPIFFAQERVGKNGRRFKLYKFRSMYLDAEERKKELMEQNKMKGFMFKMDDDPRIIKGVGHFIRKASIDELPQFWNVLRGDMSLVGTRPPTVDEYEQYARRHKVRLAFRPGITGMWQVSGRSDITDFEEVVRLDEEYISNWNIWLDIQILLKTVVVVLKGKGSE